MNLRTQCRNEGLRLKHTKYKTRIFILLKKKKAKCTGYVICTQLVQLTSWRKRDPRYSHQRQQINKIVLAQDGVRMSLEAAGLQLFPRSPLSPVITTHCLRHFSAFCPKREL